MERNVLTGSIAHCHQEIAEKRARESKKKEDLTTDIGKYGGLWTTEEAVRSTLASLRTISEKRAALRAQLLFRKVVWQQEAPSATFQLSRAGKQLPTEDLLTNLRSLLPESSLALSVGSTMIETRRERPLTELEIEPPSKRGPVEN